MTATPATSKQVAFATSLALELGWTPPELMTKDGASKFISSALEAKAVRAQLLGVTGLQPGYHVLSDGTVVKAKANKKGTNVYVMTWTGTGWAYDAGNQAAIKAQCNSANRQEMAPEGVAA